MFYQTDIDTDINTSTAASPTEIIPTREPPALIRRCTTVYGESIRSLLDEFEDTFISDERRNIDSFMCRDLVCEYYDEDYSENYTLPEDQLYGDEEVDNIDFEINAITHRMSNSVEDDQDDEDDEETTVNGEHVEDRPYVNIVGYNDTSDEEEDLVPHPNITIRKKHTNANLNIIKDYDSDETDDEK